MFHVACIEELIATESLHLAYLKSPFRCQCENSEAESTLLCFDAVTMQREDRRTIFRRRCRSNHRFGRGVLLGAFVEFQQTRSNVAEHKTVKQQCQNTQD